MFQINCILRRQREQLRARAQQAPTAGAPRAGWVGTGPAGAEATVGMPPPSRRPLTAPAWQAAAPEREAPLLAAAWSSVGAGQRLARCAAWFELLLRCSALLAGGRGQTALAGQGIREVRRLSNNASTRQVCKTCHRNRGAGAWSGRGMVAPAAKPLPPWDLLQLANGSVSTVDDFLQCSASDRSGTRKLASPKEASGDAGPRPFAVVVRSCPLSFMQGCVSSIGMQGWSWRAAFGRRSCRRRCCRRRVAGKRSFSWLLLAKRARRTQHARGLSGCGTATFSSF